jgi:hypothetical protein
MKKEVKRILRKGDEEVGGEENFERNKEDYNQRNECGNDDTMHGHGVRGSNSNIAGRCRFKWKELNVIL